MDSSIKIALILTAFNKMSGVLDPALDRSREKLKQMQDASKKMAEGFALIGAGKAGFNFLAGPIKDFAAVEKDAARLRSNLMGANGLLDEAQWKRVNGLANELGNKLPGNTADFYQMFTVMRQLGMDTETILGGAGSAAANLAVAIGESYTTVAETAGKLQNATGVQAKDMTAFFDTIARTKNMGVQLYDMEQAFARSGGQLKFLGIQGLEASQKMSAFYATFIRHCLGGQTVGTNFSRILSEMLNPDKYNKMNAAARQYGITLEVLDKKGNFLGIDNFIAQFDKLKNLTTNQISTVLSPLTGAEGLDDQMLKALSRGRDDYDKMVKGMGGQASLDQKVNTQLATLDAQWEALTGTWTNVKAAFGASLKPTLDALLNILNKGAAWMQIFVEQHPKIAQFVGTFIAIASAGLMIAGVIRVIQGITAVMQILNITLMANPIVLIAALIIAAVALIYTNWDKIVPYFKSIWAGIKGAFSAVGDWFRNMWEGVKSTFQGFMNFMFSWPARLVVAGENIVNNIWQGIKNKWGAFIAWWHEKMQAIRNYLPFSPAKVGPLRDIHRIKLMETIAMGIKPQPLMNAMNSSLNTVASISPRRSGGSSSNSTFHFSPVINLSGGATQKDADLLTSTMKQQLRQFMQQEMANKQRVSY